MLDELLRQPGVEEIVELQMPFGFMAFHGGNLERGTDVVARAAADAAGSSLYAVLQPQGFRWHVPSIAFDPAQSPRLASFLDHVDDAVAVHGYWRHALGLALLLGGRNRALAAHLASYLRDAVPHYDVIDDLERIPRELRGLHPRNPVNRVRNGGVQLELPVPARDGADATAVAAALADAARSWSAPR